MVHASIIASGSNVLIGVTLASWVKTAQSPPPALKQAAEAR
ncbi:guanosine 5'-monophosphate oxidoreductase [Vibrio mediterranei AK1]|nr:guanosine 5'-monophosphate oxidoreductase [Vibrio mediterranei AK1]